jgi:seryl-tRNA(Sec) selenium transferase
VEVNNIRLNEDAIISFKPAKQNTFELTFNKLILIGMAFIALGFFSSSSSKSNSKYSEQQLMQIAQQLEDDTNRLKEKENELYLRELNLRIESERQQEKLDQARRIHTSPIPSYNYQNNANTQYVDITKGSDIKAKSLSSDCKSWINSNIIEPSLDKEKYIKENCS